MIVIRKRLKRITVTKICKIRHPLCYVRHHFSIAIYGLPNAYGVRYAAIVVVCC